MTRRDSCAQRGGHAQTLADVHTGVHTGMPRRPIWRVADSSPTQPRKKPEKTGGKWATPTTFGTSVLMYTTLGDEKSEPPSPLQKGSTIESWRFRKPLLYPSELRGHVEAGTMGYVGLRSPAGTLLKLAHHRVIAEASIALGCFDRLVTQHLL